MTTAFARQSKITDVVGRSDYISNEKRQEQIIIHSKAYMKNTWEEYAKFEVENQKSNSQNNQAREIIIALPHDLAQSKNLLRIIVRQYALETLGMNRDFEYAVHWNKNKTNLHAHILFSERERQEEKPKRYKRDYYYNFDEGKMSNKKDPGAKIIYKKGDIQIDKTTGEIKYENKFTVKEKKFVSREFNEVIKINLKNILTGRNYDYRLFDKEIEIAQVHVGHEKKYAKSPELYKKRVETNELKSNYNKEIIKAVESGHVSKPEAMKTKIKISKFGGKHLNNNLLSQTKALIDFVIEKIRQEKEANQPLWMKELKELKVKINIVIEEYNTKIKQRDEYYVKSDQWKQNKAHLNTLEHELQALESKKYSFVKYLVEKPKDSSRVKEIKRTMDEISTLNIDGYVEETSPYENKFDELSTKLSKEIRDLDTEIIIPGIEEVEEREDLKENYDAIMERRKDYAREMEIENERQAIRKRFEEKNAELKRRKEEELRRKKEEEEYKNRVVDEKPDRGWGPRL